MHKIETPTLVVDADKCRRNIRHMKEKADRSNTALRPHFKTHQSPAVGEWFREFGVTKITVSSLKMAEFFASHNWDDIMVAFPLNIREMNRVNELAAKIKLSLLIADTTIMDTMVTQIKYPVDFYLKLETGSLRAGFRPEDHHLMDDVIARGTSSEYLNFAGFVAHAGHTYQTTSLNDVGKIYREGTEMLREVTDKYRVFYPNLITSWGDTPTCSLENDFEGIDEIRPGNFVFYDLTQFHLASCDWDEIAVTVAAPVVAKYKYRNEILLYAGAVHLSKDFIQTGDRQQAFGEIVKYTEDGWERFTEPLLINRLSQEHGTFYCPDEYWGEFKTGELVGIIPVHSCLTANLIRNYYDLKSGQFLDSGQ